MLWWHWLILALLLWLLEVLTPGGFLAFFFGVGALLVGALLGMGVPMPVALQWLLFAALSTSALVVFRRRAQAALHGGNPADVDTIVGEAAVCTQEMQPATIGRVECRGSSWQARNTGTAAIVVGQRCRVSGIRGLQLEVQLEKV